MVNNFFEESDIDLGGFLGNSDIDLGVKISEEINGTVDLQRTAEWFEQRRGKYNASESKTLMTCTQKYAKSSWHNPYKYLAFSDGALKYIFKKAKERQTGRIIETPSTAQMKYGTAIEDLIFRRGNEILKEKGLYLEKVGYKTFDDIPNAGASCDSIVKKISNGSVVASGEMKACTSWDTFFERTFDNTDEKSMDFWQTLQQMLAWNVSESYYFVASPPSDINKYIYSDNIDEMYDEWCDETELSVEIIERSEIHADNLRKRMLIAEEVIRRYLETNENIREILYEVIEECRYSEPENIVIISNEKSESKEIKSIEYIDDVPF
jgi:hypothetical protein